jgi:diguanylate cyclase (GGDEF)-like protein
MNIYFSILLLIASLPSIAALAILFRRRSGQESSSLFFFLFTIAFWALTYAFHWLAITPDNKSFWLDVSYIPVAVLPAAYVIVAFQYTRYQRWLSPPTVALLMLEPVITLSVLATDSQTGWFSGGKHTVLDTVILDGGVYFWFHVVYSYTLIFASIIVLIQYARRAHQFFRFQMLLTVSLVLPWLVNLFSILKLTPWPGLDATPIAFALTGTVILYDLRGLRLLDIIPIARDILVDNMPDGLFVLDTSNRLVDFNPVARDKPITPEALVIGGKIESVFTRWPEITEQLDKNTEAINIEICVREDPPNYIDLRIAPLYNNRQEMLGRLFTWSDVTVRKKTELSLQEANQNLHTRIDEIQKLQLKLAEQALRDGLTGVYNRRYLDGTLGREVEYARRKSRSLSVVIMDIDWFKNVNDRYGHQAGDIALKSFAGLLMHYVRASDILCRYGGEEFVVVMPETDSFTAARRAEEWRSKIQEMEIDTAAGLIRLTTSIGIATFPGHGVSPDTLLNAADHALYVAKHSGKNQVVIFTNENDQAETRQ